MLPGLETCSYKDRLDELDLFLMNNSRLSGDLLKVYGISRKDRSSVLFQSRGVYR